MVDSFRSEWSEKKLFWNMLLVNLKDAFERKNSKAWQRQQLNLSKTVRPNFKL